MTSHQETSLANRQYQDSFSLLETMFDRMQRDFFGSSLFNAWLPTRATDREGVMPRLPRTQMRDAGDAIEVTAELPGIKPEDVELHLDGDMLTVRGETTEESADGERVERCFFRQLQVPDSVDPEQVRASYKDGMLKIRMAKQSRREGAKRIPIESQASEQSQTQQQGGQQQRSRAA